MGALQDPDNHLIQRTREGDRSAFNQLVLKYRGRVMGVAARMLGDRVEAEDLAQEVFVKAYHGIKRFQGAALFSTWLYRITANSCLNQRRRRRAEYQAARDTDPADLILPDHSSNPHSLLEEKEIKMLIEKAVQALPQEQRIVLILRDIEGLTYEAIAEALALELGTVRSRLHRARMALQEKLRKVISPGV